jgi:hypothetical protein
MKKVFLVMMLGLLSIQCQAAWTTMTTPYTDVNFKDMCVLSDQDIWISGSGGAIIHYDGANWETRNSGTEQDLYAIDMIDANEGWAVGEGVILHCDSGIWIVMPDVDPQISFKDVHIFSNDDVYFVGYGFTSGGVVLHWTGTMLLNDFQVNGNIETLAADSKENIWSVGAGNIRIHYDGASWSVDNSALPESINIHGVAIGQDGEPLICGNLSDTSHWDQGRIFAHTASGWTTVYSDLTSALLFDITLNSNLGCCAGEDGFLLERVNSGWKKTSHVSNEQINKMEFVNSLSGWGVCNKGLVLRWQFDEPVIELYLSEAVFHNYDLFASFYGIANTEISRTMDLYIALEVYGTFYFWPTFTSDVSPTSIPMTADSYYIDEILPAFHWPPIQGSAEGLKFWGVILSNGDLISYTNVTFGWE